MPKLFRHSQSWLMYLIECYKYFIFYSILLGMCFCTELAFAQNNENLTEMPLEDLLTKEVTTASKLAQQISDSASAVRIVTAKDIKSYGYHSRYYR